MTAVKSLTWQCHLAHRRGAAVVAVVLACLLNSLACGEQPLDLQPATTDIPQFQLEDAPPGTQTFLKGLLVELLPHEFEDTGKWGGTKQVWDGLHMRMEGLELKTKRRWKEVNHGTWKKHRITLVDPQQFMRAKVTNIQRTAPGQLDFDLALAARLAIYGRLQEWQRGIRLFSISAEATADVELDAHLVVETKLDGKQVPPGIVIRPSAESAELRLQDFRLHRISKAHGPLVDELGDGLERTVRKELAQRNAEVVEKINRQLAKNQDDLHLSVQSLIKKNWLSAD